MLSYLITASFVNHLENILKSIDRLSCCCYSQKKSDRESSHEWGGL